MKNHSFAFLYFCIFIFIYFLLINFVFLFYSLLNSLYIFFIYICIFVVCIYFFAVAAYFPLHVTLLRHNMLTVDTNLNFVCCQCKQFIPLKLLMKTVMVETSSE